MNFFILLSSLCGIVGKEGQANYAAGNTYMDTLAARRTETGEKAASIALGMMEDAGMLAENADLMAKMRTAGTWMPVLPKELRALLDHFCDFGLPVLSPLKMPRRHWPRNARKSTRQGPRAIVLDAPAHWSSLLLARRHHRLLPSTDADAEKTLVDLSKLFRVRGLAGRGRRHRDAGVDGEVGQVCLYREGGRRRQRADASVRSRFLDGRRAAQLVREETERRRRRVRDPGRLDVRSCGLGGCGEEFVPAGGVGRRRGVRR